MRLKKCVLSFLRKLAQDEVSFMTDGSAFQARGTWPINWQGHNYGVFWVLKHARNKKENIMYNFSIHGVYGCTNF